MTPDKTRKPINPLTIWVPIIIAALGLVVWWNYLVKLGAEKQNPRPPVISRLEKNITFTERSGQPVQLKELNGKIIIACWVFTRCPRGCPGVVAEMQKLYKDVGDNPNVHFLSVSVDPDDTPEHMRKFTENFKIEGKNWWFVNGPKDDVRHYMTKYFSFAPVQDLPEKDRLSPDDKFIHDMKVVLVDQMGQVRGRYDIGSADPEFRDADGKRIRDDIAFFLKDPPTAGKP